MNLTTDKILLYTALAIAFFFLIMTAILSVVCKVKNQQLEKLNEELEIEQPWELLDEEGHYAIPFATQLFLYDGENLESRGTVLKNYHYFSNKGIEKFLDSGDFSKSLHPHVTFFEGSADSNYCVIETELDYKFLVSTATENFPEELLIVRKKKNEQSERQNGQQ